MNFKSANSNYNLVIITKLNIYFSDLKHHINMVERNSH